MALNTNSQTLRAVGQAMERRRLEDFDLKYHEGEFIVRARPALPEGGEKLLRDIFRRLRRQREGFIELHYTPEDIDRLDKQGRTSRRDKSRTPDFYTLSQILRTVGAYVDQKGALLLAVSRSGSRLTIQYKMGEGQLTIENHDVPSLYNFFSQMCLRRGVAYSPGEGSC